MNKNAVLLEQREIQRLNLMRMRRCTFLQLFVNLFFDNMGRAAILSGTVVNNTIYYT
jgi:hypothetical protein